MVDALGLEEFLTTVMPISVSICWRFASALRRFASFVSARKLSKCFCNFVWDKEYFSE